MPVIDAALVQRWVQDPPAITQGEAFFSLTAEALVAVAVTGTAELAFAAEFLTAVPQIGDAEIAADTVISLLAAVVGDAEAAIESSAESADVNLTAGIALAEIAASAEVAVEVDGDANIVIFDISTFAPALVGSATVSMEDLGQGSPPLFPFQLPTRFTDNPLGIQKADAIIVITGFSDDVAVAGFADAVVRIVDTGPTFPYYFPLQCEGLQGSTPIVPFVFPAVFTAAANVNLATATIAFDGDGDTVVSVLADAQAAITATGSRVSPSTFPFTLPAEFFSDTYVNPAEFPFVLPAQFV
jgi:hypothetical protein